MFFVYDESTGSLRDPRDPNPVNFNLFSGIPFDDSESVVREGRLDYPAAIEARAVEVQASNNKSENDPND